MADPKIICISHGEDADGLTCAALLLRLKKASPILVTYDEFAEVLRKLEPPLGELYICDLNIREALIGEVLRINGFTNVTIIDHHPTSEGLMEKLGEAGVTVVYSPLDCASVLLYDHFREKLGRRAGRLAAYTAWSDQFEDGPIATRLLMEYDRQFVQHEALILTHALSRKPTIQFRLRVVEELSKLTYPHRIVDAPKAALSTLEDISNLLDTLATTATRTGDVAYIKAPRGKSVGMLAGLLIDALGVDIGLSYKFKGEDLVNISIRSRRGLPFHLGEVARRIASTYGGFGGGHKRASGASIPRVNLQGFIDDLKAELI